ncbi:MAG: outer membrane protein assembly factor BamD [Planctomycetota bacterium]|jgi:tetratricopeptide (TPR) repeat protein
MRPSRLVISISLAIMAQAVSAQVTEYTLEPDGSLRATRQPAAGSDEAAVAQARALLAQDRPSAALDTIDDWIRQNDFEGGGTSEWLAEAYLLKGDCLLAMRREYKALLVYEPLIERFPASDSFVAAIQRELDVAQAYSDGLRRRVLGFRTGKTRTIAEELMIRAQERMPGSVVAERAAIMLAEHYYKTRQMELASEAFDLYLLNFPDGPNRARAMQGRIYANIAQFKGPRYDTSTILDAQQQIRTFMRMMPSDAERLGIDAALLIRLDDSLAGQQMETARWYLRRGEDASARYILKRVMRDHPESALAGEALMILQDRGWLDEPSQEAH